MKKLVNFEKIDVIKELIKEKEQNIDNKTDYENRLVGDTIIDYFYEYVEPLIIELNDKGVLEYDTRQLKENTDSRRIFLKATSIIRETLNSKDSEDITFQNDKEFIENQFEMFGLDKYRKMCDDKGIFFLSSKDNKLKNEFALKIKDMFEYEYIITNYAEMYINPLLVQLSKSNSIKYFEKPKTDEEKYINTTIESIMISIINQLYYNKSSIGNYDTILDVIKSDNDKDKSQLALTIYLEIFLQNFSDEDLNDMYNEAVVFCKNKNKYSQYDYNDYNKVITTIFDIK